MGRYAWVSDLLWFMINRPIGYATSFVVGCSQQGPNSDGGDAEIQADVHTKEVAQILHL